MNRSLIFIWGALFFLNTFWAHPATLDNSGITEPERKNMRLNMILPLSPRFSSAVEPVVMVNEDSTQGTDPKVPFRSLKSRSTSAFPVSSKLQFINGGADLITRLSSRGFFAARSKELFLASNVVFSAQGWFTNLTLVTNEVVRSLGPSPGPVPKYYFIVDLVHCSEQPIRSRTISTVISALVGPLSTAFGIDASARRSEAWNELKVSCTIGDFLSQTALSEGNVLGKLRKLDRSAQLGLRFAARAGVSGDYNDVSADSIEVLLSAACAEALNLSLVRLAGLPPRAISATGENDPASRFAMETAWSKSSVEGRRASVTFAKRLAMETGFRPAVWPDPESPRAASLWREILEQMPLPCQPFDPAPNSKVARNRIRVVYEFFAPRKWILLRPRVAELLAKAPGVTTVSPDPVAPDFGFLVHLSEGHIRGLRDHLLGQMKALTGASADSQIPSGEGRTLYIQFRPSI